MLKLERKERMASVAGVALLHMLLGGALLLGFAPVLVRQASESLDVFNVRPAPPPPPLPDTEPPPRPEPTPESAPAPVRPESEAAAPSARRRTAAEDVPPPVAAGIVPSEGGDSAPLSGRPQWMTGAGAGGAAGASGRGEAGSGAGGGGSGGTGIAVVRARLRGGRIAPADYPRAAGGQQGTVRAELTVSAAGAVTRCTIVRSSGSAVLDDTTCRLIRERFRFTPARDARGRAVADVQGWEQRWWRD